MTIGIGIVGSGFMSRTYAYGVRELVDTGAPTAGEIVLSRTMAVASNVPSALRAPSDMLPLVRRKISPVYASSKSATSRRLASAYGKFRTARPASMLCDGRSSSGTATSTRLRRTETSRALARD